MRSDHRLPVEAWAKCIVRATRVSIAQSPSKALPQHLLCQHLKATALCLLAGDVRFFWSRNTVTKLTAFSPQDFNCRSSILPRLRVFLLHSALIRDMKVRESNNANFVVPATASKRAAGKGRLNSVEETMRRVAVILGLCRHVWHILRQCARARGVDVLRSCFDSLRQSFTKLIPAFDKAESGNGLNVLCKTLHASSNRNMENT